MVRTLVPVKAFRSSSIKLDYLISFGLLDLASSDFLAGIRIMNNEFKLFVLILMRMLFINKIQISISH